MPLYLKMSENIYQTTRYFKISLYFDSYKLLRTDNDTKSKLYTARSIKKR